MGAYIPCRMYSNTSGVVFAPRLRKRPSETFVDRLGRVAAQALQCRVKHYAIRRYGTWMIYNVSGPPSMPLHTGLTQAAAEMWLLHRGARTP